MNRGNRPVTRFDAPPYFSANQRLVVLTFPDVEEAEAWDAAGQPIRLVLEDT